MKRLITLLCVMLPIAAMAADADTPLKVEHLLPAEAPVAVVLVAQCGSAIGIYATMADGTLLAFDMSSGISFKDQTAWANQAKRAITVDTKCVIAPGDLKI